MANLSTTSRLLAVSRAAALVTIAVMAWHVNLPLGLSGFDAASLPLPDLAPAISLAEVTGLIAMVAYALAGWPNFRIWRSGWRKIFAVSLAGLALFETLSIDWSIQPGLAAVQTGHVAIWLAFALMIACADWSISVMTLALLVGVLANSLAGFVEIARQPFVPIIPQNSGVSVVFNGDQHWLRVYGLSPHPNLLGGHLAVGVILTLGLILTSRRIRQAWLIAAWLISWVTLLLTFSRSAWLAVLVGGWAALVLLTRSGLLNRLRRKSLLFLPGFGLLVVFVFVLGFQPFLANRFDVAATPYEAQAITDRISTAQLALQIFSAHPWVGIGLSQFVVVARDLIGTSIDWVHNVPLLAAAELGIGGMVLIGPMMMSLGAIGVQRWRTRSISLWQALIGGGLIALMVVMQFDHYVWTTPQGGLLWAWLVGGWLRADHMTAS